MTPGATAPQPAPTNAPAERQPMTLLWTVLAVLLVVLSVTLGGSLRPTLLKAVLVLTAVGEALAFVSNSFRPRQFAELNGRPFDLAFHGVMQDFGFYNLAFAGLLALAALDPGSPLPPLRASSCAGCGSPRTTRASSSARSRISTRRPPPAITHLSNSWGCFDTGCSGALVPSRAAIPRPVRLPDLGYSAVGVVDLLGEERGGRRRARAT
jgi:hypothetical protein